ncbi:OB-fold nucleic acid binding domain-containing protein [Anabaenopsis elenkinii]|uniref:OB-fold nucleic acid binding domain-containing protein n=1 Tax=Anabaenopsis elenkinii CCIBt3563 TaxID=2779889 RepID=A0A7U3NMT5_9CYAN|nr:OB-fold nucleic acid binding domain-containing protein [Anabaenopsis elenkinii]QOV21836.1 OB-fold nucleic acid binding domain-containing protein [Anabaenopsis elenkinii CCIBt3563]
MNHLKKFVTEPRYPLILFAGITFVIWIFGKFYQPILSEAQVYSGESISSNSIGQLVVSEGIVINSYRNKQGIQFLTLKSENGEYRVSFFPSLGKLSFVPRKGDLVRVTGLLNIYRKQPQISPLSYQSITKISDESSATTIVSPYPIIDITEVNKYMGQTVWINNLIPTSVEKFTSQKGYKMLRFQVTSSTGISVNGIFFEGNWDKETLDIMLSSQKRISMLATIGEFRGEVSLNGKQVRFD